MTLWRSRRLDDGHVRRYVRRASSPLACLPAFFFGRDARSASATSRTHVGRGIATDVDLPATAHPVTFTTSDGLTLHGTYIPSTNGAAVIVSPGYNEAPAHARMLARHGYGVLLFDQRGEGRSDGDPNGWGWAAEKDMVGALRFLQAQPDVRDGRIGGIGLSVAGESLLQTAAHHDDLKAVVAEGAGSRSYKEEYDLPRSIYDTAFMVPFAIASTVWTSVFADELAPAHLADVVADVAPAAVPHLDEAGRVGAADAGVRRAREGPDDRLGGVRRRPHEGARDPPAGVRAARRRLPRRRPPRRLGHPSHPARRRRPPIPPMGEAAGGV